MGKMSSTKLSQESTKLSIALITENFVRCWSPNELESFLGGGQESVVYLAEELGIPVFLSGETKMETAVRKNVIYRDFSEFKDEYDIVILFKINPLKSKLKAKVIFWSSDVQTSVYDPYGNISRYVCLTEYHRTRNNWVADVLPLGIDRESLESNKVEKKENTMLYSASLDRGFETLLNSWDKIREKYPGIRLYVTYGTAISQKINPSNKEKWLLFERNMSSICEKIGIDYLGTVSKEEMEKLYWSCQYWVHPLNRADSELFCLNAIKAQICGCIPVVYRIGALEETVGNYIDFDDFVKGEKKLRNTENFVPIYTWKEVGEKWRNMLESCLKNSL